MAVTWKLNVFNSSETKKVDALHVRSIAGKTINLKTCSDRPVAGKLCSRA